jgi:MFS family permease
MTWDQFLTFLTQTSGIQVVLGFALSLISEYFPKFDAYSKQTKQAIFFGICMIIPLLGCALGVLTAGWPLSWEMVFWPALVAGFTAFTSGTLFHAVKSTRTERRLNKRIENSY